MATERELGKSGFVCPYCNAFALQQWSWLLAVPTVAADVADEDEWNSFLPEELDREAVSAEIDAICDHSSDPYEIQSAQVGRLQVFLQKQIMTRTVRNVQRFEERSPLKGVMNLMLSECFSCKRIAVWEDKTLIHPQASSAQPPHEDMPDEVKKIYNEAAAISQRSPRAAGALLRLALEKLAIHSGAKPAKLYKMIGELTKGNLDKSLQKAMDILRHYGNDAVHAPAEIVENEVSGEDRVYFWLLNYLARSLISEPNEIDGIFDDLPESVKAGVRKRDD